jgi:hypothetical protein
MRDPPSVVRKVVRRGKWKRAIASALMNRTVLVASMRLGTAIVRLVRLLLGGD